MNLTTIILAAGKGTRMNSELPKVLVQVHGKPMVHYCIQLSEAVGANRTVLVVGYKRDEVIEATRDLNVDFVIQDPPMGTGHAVLVTEEALTDTSGDILILYGDVPSLRKETIEQLIQDHRIRESVCTVLTAELENPFNYGRIIRNEQNELLKIVEEKNATESEKAVREINSGIYVFKKEALFDALHQVQPNEVTGEYYLTDVIDIFARNGQKVSAVIAENPNEILGVNTFEQLAELEAKMQM